MGSASNREICIAVWLARLLIKGGEATLPLAIRNERASLMCFTISEAFMSAGVSSRALADQRLQLCFSTALEVQPCCANTQVLPTSSCAG